MLISPVLLIVYIRHGVAARLPSRLLLAIEGERNRLVHLAKCPFLTETLSGDNKRELSNLPVS